MAADRDDALTWLSGLEFFGIKLGLDNISTLVAALGHPERTFRVIHVGGTNGKGSVTAMVDASLRAAGLRSGRYTSPHLVDLTERFVVDGVPVSRSLLETVLGDLRSRVDALQRAGELPNPPTFFEATTAAAFEIFRRSKVEVAVCEVGLGGRLDATNVVTPIVTAITSVGLDHQQHLGPTIADIAAEKAGIIKRGIPAVIGPLPPEAKAVVETRARERGAPIVHSMDGVVVKSAGGSSIGEPSRVLLTTPRQDYGELAIALSGPHQIDNAIVAVRTLEAASEALSGVSTQAIAHGLADVSWPGRMDLRRTHDGRDVLFDAAHNPDGAAALARALARDATWSNPPLVFAAMQDKDAAAMLRALAGVVGPIVCTRPSNPRATAPETLVEIAERAASGHVVVAESDPARALALAWQRGPRIVVSGSIFLVSEVLEALGMPCYPQKRLS